MQVGTTKDQGLYNKLSAAVHPGALAAGTLPHNITYMVIYWKMCLVRNFLIRTALSVIILRNMVVCFSRVLQSS